MCNRADGTREQVTEAQRRMAFNEYMANIRLEINNNAQWASTSACMNIQKDDPEYVSKAVELLTEDGYDVNTDEGSLYISWENKE